MNFKAFRKLVVLLTIEIVWLKPLIAIDMTRWGTIVSIDNYTSIFDDQTTHLMRNTFGFLREKSCHPHVNLII
jgi:hypothetical protein